MDNIKKTIGGLAIAGVLAGSAILGGVEMQKQEVRNYRMGLIERLEFTKNKSIRIHRRITFIHKLYS